MRHYSIRRLKDQGCGEHNLYCDGDWLMTARTREECEAEQKNRELFDKTWLRDHGHVV